MARLHRTEILEAAESKSTVGRLILLVLLDIRDQNEELLNFVRED